MTSTTEEKQTANAGADSSPRCALASGSAGSILAKLHPKHGEKYSANLYRFLSANRAYAEHGRAYVDADGVMMLGINDDGWFHGTRMMRILCVGKKAECYAYSPGHIKGLREVVGFWDEYLRIGRCAIDAAHTIAFLNADSRFVEDGDARACTWCGHQQRRERYRAHRKLNT